MSERSTSSVLEGRTIGITGITGFLGGNLASILVKRGSSVTGLDYHLPNPEAVYSLLGIERSIEEVQGDITDYAQVRQWLSTSRPAVVYHFASMAFVPECRRMPRQCFAVNVQGTINIIEACREMRGIVEGLVIASTDQVFGDVSPEQMPLREDARLGVGSNPYAASKAAMELTVRSLYQTYRDELPSIAIVRTASVFGYGDPHRQRIIPLFTAAAAKRELLPLRYRLNGRQFIQVMDACHGYIRAAEVLSDTRRPVDERGNLVVPTFHLSMESYPNTQEPFIRMQALAELVASLTGTTVCETVNCVDFAPGENPIQAITGTKTRSLLEWSPTRDFTETLKAICKWYHPELTTAMRRRMLSEEIDKAIHST